MARTTLEGRVGADLRAARREPGCQPATGRLGDPALLPTPQSATRWRSALSTTSSWRVCPLKSQSTWTRSGDSESRLPARGQVFRIASTVKEAPAPI